MRARPWAVCRSFPARLAAAVLGLLCLTALPQAAIANASPPSATRAHSEAGHAEHSRPEAFTAEVAYTVDAWTAAHGGLRKDVRYLDNLDVLLTMDLERLFALPRTTAFVYGLYNNGARFSDGVAGDAQGLSNIETGVRAARLYEAWLEHTGASGRWSLKGGLYDLNSEFDALETSSLFIGSAHGIGTDIAQTGHNGPSIFPSTSLAIRLQTSINDSLALRMAVLDGVPGNLDRPARTTIRLGNGEGALLIGEADYAFASARLIGGLWRYTGAFEDQWRSALADAPVLRKGGNTGVYLRGEAQMTGAPDERGIRGFFRLGLADGRFNRFGTFAAVGLVGKGLIPTRAADESGIALAWAEASTDFERAARVASASASAGREIVVELTHRILLNDWLAIQPNVQYVVNPGLDRLANDLVAVGMRFEVKYPQ